MGNPRRERPATSSRPRWRAAGPGRTSCPRNGLACVGQAPRPLERARGTAPARTALRADRPQRHARRTSARRSSRRCSSRSPRRRSPKARATGPELRALVGAEKKQVDAAVAVLQRALVLTNAGVVAAAARLGRDRGRRARAPLRRHARSRRRQTPAACSRATVLASSGELSAADLGGRARLALQRSPAKRSTSSRRTAAPSRASSTA